MDAPRGLQPWMRIGVPELDHDHQKMLTACDLFADAIAVDERQAAALLLDALIATAVEHFAKEERILVATGYPMTEAHIRHHDEARRRLRRLSEEFAASGCDVAGTAADIKRFFLDTLIPDDLRYRPYVEAGMPHPSATSIIERLAVDLLAAHGGAAVAIAEGVRASMSACGATEQAALWDDVVRHVNGRLQAAAGG